jgi:hypothetical protein
MGVLMDISTLSTPTQVILALLLFGLLLAWLIVFAAMAFWPDRERLDDFDDLPTPANSFPVVAVQAAQPAHSMQSAKSRQSVAALSPVRVSTAAPMQDGVSYDVGKDNSPASTFRPPARD